MCLGGRGGGGAGVPLRLIDFAFCSTGERSSLVTLTVKLRWPETCSEPTHWAGVNILHFKNQTGPRAHLSPHPMYNVTPFLASEETDGDERKKNKYSYS